MKQQEEMKAVEDQIRKLRHEYDRVCKERGRAHVSAQLVRLHEQQVADFDKKRDQLVKLRAQEVARKEARKVVVQNEVKRDAKIRALEVRKKLLDTDWTCPPPDASQYWHELKSLSRLEDALEKEVQSKKRRSISCQVTLSDSSSSSCDSAFTPETSLDDCCLNEIAARVLNKLRILQQNEQQERILQQNEQQENLQKQTSSRPQHIQRRAVVPAKTQSIHPHIQSKKVVRDVAINTSFAPSVSNTLCIEPERSSSSTSYRSLPEQIGQHNRHDMERIKEFVTTRAKTGLEAVNRSIISVDQVNDDRHVSGFWNRVFDAAGIPLNDSTMMLVKDLEQHEGDSVEKSFSCLSISSKTCIGSPSKHSTPFNSTHTSPAK